MKVTEGLPPWKAQQLFSLGSVVAGSLAGFYMAKKLSVSNDVPPSSVFMGTIVLVAANIIAAYMVVRAVQSG